MKLHFYGTGASEGVPSLFCSCPVCQRVRALGPQEYRSRTSCGIDDELLVDFSSDTFDHMRTGGLDLTRIRTILFTHAHPDHFYPEDLVRLAPHYAMPDDRPGIDVYGSETIARRIAAQGGPKPGDYLRMHVIRPMESFSTGGCDVRALPAQHDSKQDCFLYRIRKEGKTLLYAHDTAYFSEETWEALSGEHLDCVVLDCTCCAKPSHFDGHMGFPENLKVKERLYSMGAADANTLFVATHFVHSDNPIREELEAVMAPHGFIAAYDGMELEV